MDTSEAETLWQEEEEELVVEVDASEWELQTSIPQAVRIDCLRGLRRLSTVDCRNKMKILIHSFDCLFQDVSHNTWPQ